MTTNTDETKQRQMANDADQSAPESADCAGENGVHIAGEHGSVYNTHANEINEQAPNYTGSDGANVPGARSSAIERPVHIGKVAGLIPAAPTKYRRFKSIQDQGFPEYFWTLVRVGKPHECWPWLASVNGNGYGQIKVGSRPLTAHRTAYALSTGTDAGSHLVCHHCDNRPCCNPAHLYAGTSTSNVADMVRRGRHSVPAGTANHFAKLDDAKVRNIRVLIGRGFKNTEIGNLVGVHHSTVSMIRTGKTWKHVA